MISTEEKIKERIELLKTSKKQRNDFEVWGGKLGLTHLIEFLNEWDFEKMPFKMIETVNEISLHTNRYPWNDIDVDLLKRIRIFGKKGDLDIRRDHYDLFWRYIAIKNEKPPVKYRNNDFWEINQDKEFFFSDGEAFLWGRYNEDLDEWKENKVAKAKLNYPIKGCDKLKITYRTYCYNGQISFVRFKNIKKVSLNES
ncbi:MAG: hypothetical protein GF308_19475 [Candidatus Heimdallarchaeota archaeon]|nr:hypothetical protein [Candidatus Heimdallarchaeota archaeon]